MHFSKLPVILYSIDFMIKAIQFISGVAVEYSSVQSKGSSVVQASITALELTSSKVSELHFGVGCGSGSRRNYSFDLNKIDFILACSGTKSS